MKVVTIVRDPFDRLRSLFGYINHNGYWKDKNTEAQYERVRAGDFAGWLYLLYSEKQTPVNAQYEYIHYDIDKAISVITGDSPKVMVLVNECFEASLRLMENKFTIQTGAADNFMQSSSFHSSQGNEINATESLNLDELRKRSKRYFPEEYRFYNAAVDQLKRQLDESRLCHYCDL